MSDSSARAIQTKLQELGFYQGEIDGLVGPQTKRALREFYRAQADLVSQGKLLADSASAFNLSASDIQPVRGEENTPPISRENANQRTQGSGTTPGSSTLSNPGATQGSMPSTGTTPSAGRPSPTPAPGTAPTPGSDLAPQQRRTRPQGTAPQGGQTNDTGSQGVSPQGTMPQTTPSTPGTSP
jgi:hypothetical protein